MNFKKIWSTAKAKISNAAFTVKVAVLTACIKILTPATAFAQDYASGTTALGDVTNELKNLSPKFNKGETINVINQKLGYLVRCGNPDAMDSIVPMAYGNLALDLISKGMHGRLVILRNGRYDNAPIDIVTSSKKLVDINKFYNTDRLRPQYNSFEFMPQMIL